MFVSNSGGSFDAYLSHEGDGLTTNLVIRGNNYQSGTVGLPITDNSSIGAPSDIN